MCLGVIDFTFKRLLIHTADAIQTDLSIPYDHLPMISFQELDGCITLFLSKGIITEKISSCCSKLDNFKRTRLHNVSQISIKYQGFQCCEPESRHCKNKERNYPTDTLRGYLMKYSFHNDSNMPQFLPKNKWNCSVSYFNTFKQHFPCDLFQDCLFGEDEIMCPYYNPACRPGSILAGDICVFVSEPIPNLQPYEASAACSLQGGTLALMKTKARVEAYSTIQKYKTSFVRAIRIYLGISTVSSDMHIW